jgi:hypothetical protein
LRWHRLHRHLRLLHQGLLLLLHHRRLLLLRHHGLVVLLLHHGLMLLHHGLVLLHHGLLLLLLHHGLVLLKHRRWCVRRCGHLRRRLRRPACARRWLPRGRGGLARAQVSHHVAFYVAKGRTSARASVRIVGNCLCILPRLSLLLLAFSLIIPLPLLLDLRLQLGALTLLLHPARA